MAPDVLQRASLPFTVRRCILVKRTTSADIAWQHGVMTMREILAILVILSLASAPAFARGGGHGGHGHTGHGYGHTGYGP